jgi:hypothetical protein
MSHFHGASASREWGQHKPPKLSLRAQRFSAMMVQMTAHTVAVFACKALPSTTFA